MTKQINTDQQITNKKTKVIAKKPKVNAKMNYIMYLKSNTTQINRWGEPKYTDGLWFSSKSYLKVTAIKKDQITVENESGVQMVVSKSILQTMDSSDHFDNEVLCTMT